MVTESVMTLDALLSQVIAQKAEVILQAKVDQLDFTTEIEQAAEDFDFGRILTNAAENFDFDPAIDAAMDNFDLDPAISKSLEEFDFEPAVSEAIKGADFPQIATEAVQEVLGRELKDLRERVVAMVAAVARDEVRKALAELTPVRKPSLWSRVWTRLGRGPWPAM